MSLYMISNKTRNAVKDRFGSYIKKTTIESDNDNATHDFTIDDTIGDESNEVFLASSIGMTATRALDNNDKSIVYLGKSLLRDGAPTLRRGEEVRVVFMRTFGWDNGAPYPFLLFCLQKDDANQLSFPKMVYEGGDVTVTGGQVLDHMFQEWSELNIDYMGYMRYGNETFLWYNGRLSNKYELVSGKYNDKLWFATVSEIVNNRKMLSFDIDQSITNLFLQNSRLIYIADSTGKPYDIPTVGYFGSYYKRIGVTAVLGVRKEGPQASLGPYYYFGAYSRAIRYALWTTDYKPKLIDGEKLTVDDTGRYTRGGIVRFALFMGKEDVKLGRDSDKKDDTNASRKFIADRPHMKDTLQMRDTAGTWSYSFDSIVQGRHTIIRKDGSEFTLSPQMVVKDYAQQFPLSYHYVDTNQDINKDDLNSIKIE